MSTDREPFVSKYPSASLFDPDDPRDARSERARVALVRAFKAEMPDVASGEDLQDVACGLLVGLIGVLACHMEATDANHAAIRAGLHQLIPWAVDMVRSMDDLPPLGDV